MVSIFCYLLNLVSSQGSHEDLGECLDELTEIIDSSEEGAVIITVGDFNGDVGHMDGLRGVSAP